MKIVLVNHTSDWSGGEAALMRLIAALSPEHECVVACPAEGTLPERLDEYGIARVALPDVDLSLRVHPVQTPIGIAQVAAAGLALQRRAREQGADLVHANSVRAGLIAAAADRLGSPPIVVQVHDDLPMTSAGRLTRSAIARTAAGIVAVSDYTAETFNKGLRFPRAERVYISIDHERFDPERVRPTDIRAELGLAPDARVIGQVAQITPWKGQDTAIRMLAGVRGRHPDTHLLLVGSITFETKATRFDNRSFYEELEALVAELGLESHVHFLGQRDDVPGLLRAFDFSVLPSWDEPFGMAAAESMAMRTPIFVSSVGGIGEYVDDGVSGRVLPPHEPDAWVAAALAALEDPDGVRAMGERARQRVLAFNDDTYGRDIGAAYERAIGRWRERERRRGRNGH
jgi:glycosyltransferase involved in cell wall biosynthesis